MTRKAQASPQKEFFLYMITRDITLRDSILDLLDNSVDGALKLARTGKRPVGTKRAFSAFKVSLVFGENGFEISDNCGGIAIENAIHYAFHFGRRSDDPNLIDHSIGLYGIGMKRAIFKMGKRATIRSETANEAFKVEIEIDKWKKQKRQLDGEIIEDWDFDLDEVEKTGNIGTSIQIRDLHPQVLSELPLTSFKRDLEKIIARDYSFFLRQGLIVELNDVSVEPHIYRLKHGGDFQPANIESRIDGVSVRVQAGLADLPSEEDDPGARKRPETEYFGWYIVCNNRVVLAGDKSDKTIWGTSDDDFPSWHPQFNGFMGLTFFDSDDPRLLPWTTTKRDIDVNHPVYRQVVQTMKEITREYIQYTHDKKEQLDEAKERERQAESSELELLPQSPRMSVPVLRKAKRTYSSIQYSRPKLEIERAKRILGDPTISNSKLGESTFEYFLAHEGDKT